MWSIYSITSKNFGAIFCAENREKAIARYKKEYPDEEIISIRVYTRSE
jgi:hypothetical protein